MAVHVQLLLLLLLLVFAPPFVLLRFFRSDSGIAVTQVSALRSVLTIESTALRRAVSNVLTLHEAVDFGSVRVCTCMTWDETLREDLLRLHRAMALSLAHSDWHVVTFQVSLGVPSRELQSGAWGRLQMNFEHV